MLRIALALTLLLINSTSFATTVKPVSLEHMARSAEIIFYGRVISNEVKLDELSQRVATFTRFEILEPIKGIDISTNTNTYTVKQFGGQLPGSQLVHRIAGIPRFTVNEEYVVFLPAASQLGFASPIGLSQGSYHVSDSGKTVSNGHANTTAEPAQTLRTAARPGDNNKTALEDFLQNVRSLSGR